MTKKITSRDLQEKLDLGIKHGLYSSAAELDKDILELEKLLEEETYQLAEKKLYDFFKLAWNWYDPNPLVDNWHLECMCEHVQAALDRQIRRLIISISPRCLEENTQVRLWDGTKKAIKDVKVGDSVSSLDTTTGLHTEGKVTDVIYNGIRDVYRITLKNGIYVDATDTHRFYTWNGYKTVKDLYINDDISLSRYYEPNLQEKNQLSEEELRSIALWMAEGHKNTGSGFRITNFDLDIVEQAKIDSHLLGFELHENIKTFSYTGFSPRFKAYPEQWVRSYFEDKNCSTYTLKIPDIIYKQNNKNLGIFLGMWIATDGYIPKNRRKIGITLASEQCILDLAELFNRLGVTPIVKYKQSFYIDKKTKKRKYFDAWELTITGRENLYACKRYLTDNVFHKQKDLDLLKIDGKYSDKEEIPYYWAIDPLNKDNYDTRRILVEKRWSNLSNIDLNKNVICNDYVKEKINKEEYWQKITNIEYLGSRAVYDISVDKYENFTLANGIHSHNSSKSTISSISAVTWQLLRKPEEKFWLISHSNKLFMQNIVYARRILDHPGYKKRWLDPKSPNYRYSLTKDQNTKTRIETSEGGYILGGSPDSGALGMGYTVAILDDILDSQESNNPDIIEKINLWYTQTFMNRSNDVNTDVVIVPMQRLASNDITGYVMKEYADQGWFQLIIPAKYDPDRTFISPIGYNDKRTKRNELMDPVRLPDSFLATQAKNKVVYNTRYQQNPEALTDGNFVEGDWIVETSILPHKYDAMLTVWDLSFDGEPESTYSVGLVMGKHENNIYILDMYRKLMNAPQQLDAIKKLKKKYPHSIIGVEKRANGSAVMSFLEREIKNIYAFQPKLFGGSKEQRLNACLEYFRKHQVHIYSPFGVDDRLEPTYSADEIKKELLQFPIGEYDDIVDCISYGVQYLMEFGQESLAIITNGEKIVLVEEDLNMRDWLKTGRSNSTGDVDFSNNADDIFSSFPTRDYIRDLF